MDCRLYSLWRRKLCCSTRLCFCFCAGPGHRQAAGQAVPGQGHRAAQGRCARHILQGTRQYCTVYHHILQGTVQYCGSSPSSRHRTVLFCVSSHSSRYKTVLYVIICMLYCTLTIRHCGSAASAATVTVSFDRKSDGEIPYTTQCASAGICSLGS